MQQHLKSKLNRIKMNLNVKIFLATSMLYIFVQNGFEMITIFETKTK